MPSSKRIVDWNALSLNEGIRLMAQALRQKLGIRLFITTKSGEIIDISPRDHCTNTVFDCVVDTNAQWSHAEEVVSFAKICDEWAEALQQCEHPEQVKSEGGITVESAPGFKALVVPVTYDGEVLAGLVASGFVPREEAVDRVEALRAVMPDHVARDVDDDDSPMRINQIGSADRHWMAYLTSKMAQKLESEVDAQSPSKIDESTHRFGGMLGKSDPMKQLFQQIETVASSESTILITGENGTGKELVARAIHRFSPRRDRPFLAVNCAAIPGELITSELFGHVEGSFSGAHQDRQGLFEAADGGTLLLDEIGDMEQPLQAKLLRVLQEGTLVRVGDTELRSVNVRVLCATNTDLEELVRSGQFRRDLYFRIRVMKLAIAPLRDRVEDIELLAHHFVAEAVRRHGGKQKELSPQALTRLTQYGWPGNVRELENEIERVVIMSGTAPVIEEEVLSPRIRNADPPEPTLDFDGYELPEAIEEVERKMILDGLRRTGWNKTQTARELGVSRRNLIRKVARYELEENHRDT